MATPRTRLELQAALEEFLGSENVYFRPPESKKLSYPCIVYDYRGGSHEYANNMTYRFNQSYDVQIIHKTADTDLIERFAYAFPKCRFDRSFQYNNLNHENFVIYT